MDIKKTSYSVLVSSVVLMIITNSQNAYSFGKKRVDPNADTQAFPARVVSLGKIYETGFKLPDGKSVVDFEQSLPIVIATTFTDFNDKIRIADLNTPPSHYVLNGGVTSFDANVVGLNVRFGYKPGVGDIGQGTIPSGTGTVGVKLNEFTMDFHIVDTESSPPTIIAAKFASAKELKIDLKVDIDFGQYQGGLDFVYNSPVTAVFRRLIRKVVDKMVEDPRTNFYMDWFGSISKVDYDNNTLFINAGMRQGIGQNNVFTVYDGTNRIGEIRVDRLELDQSLAHYKDDTQNTMLKSTKSGDSVRIFFGKSPAK